MENKGKVTVVLDSMAGSCGKGKFIGYLSLADKYDIAINNFMSNAGHTFEYNDGTRIMTQHLPTSIVSPITKLIIGPGAAITPEILFNEILKYEDIINERVVIIHPRAMVINERHRELEKQIVRSGSTFKGCGTAQADKVMRVPDIQLFGDWFNNMENWINTRVECGKCDDNLMNSSQVNYIKDTICVMDHMAYINNEIDMREKVIIEGSQGCDLDINYGLDYPNVTSRQCHAGQLIADCGISPRLVDDIIMIMRPYPIRISNQTNIGIEISSGDYAGSPEITWDIVKDRCGAPDNIDFGEMTTVTKKMRRVFEMNWDRLRYVVKLNRPTQIGLNFAQYIDYNILGCTKPNEITPKVKEFIDKIEKVTGVPVTLIGTGAKNNEIIDLRSIKL